MLQAKKSDPSKESPDLVEESDLDKGESGDGKIRCPRCKWRPRKTDLWGCKCGHAWNTFDTRGRCPECHYQWRHTRCLRCYEWSPHEDWYEKDAPPHA